VTVSILHHFPDIERRHVTLNIYHFLLVVYSNDYAIWHRFPDITTFTHDPVGISPRSLASALCKIRMVEALRCSLHSFAVWRCSC